MSVPLDEADDLRRIREIALRVLGLPCSMRPTVLLVEELARRMALDEEEKP